MSLRIRIPLRATGVALALALTMSGCAENPPLPWAFNGIRADGYSVDLVSVVPSPGTPLAKGADVDFSVTVAYSMTISPRGQVTLVVEDDQDRLLPTDSQPMVEVASGSGRVTLSQHVKIPATAKEIRLFVPLAPDGLKTTYGEVTIRYPIVQAN